MWTYLYWFLILYNFCIASSLRTTPCAIHFWYRIWVFIFYTLKLLYCAISNNQKLCDSFNWTKTIFLWVYIFYRNEYIYPLSLYNSFINDVTVFSVIYYPRWFMNLSTLFSVCKFNHIVILHIVLYHSCFWCGTMTVLYLFSTI